MIIGIQKDIEFPVSKTKFIFLWLPVFKVINKMINGEKRIIIGTLFGFLNVYKIRETKGEVYKKLISIFYIPMFKTIVFNNEGITKLLGMVIYRKKTNSNYSSNTNTLLEVELLVKSVASGLRDIKRLENKLNNIK
jgi:hypothetical protein